MLFRVRHFFIPPFPTSLSRTFNRFKKEGRKITVNLYNSEIDKYSESPLLDPQASFSNMSQKEKYSLLELLYFLADSSTFFRFFWHVHTETCHLKGIMANSWNHWMRQTPQVCPQRTQTVWLKSKLQFICIEVKQICIYYILFYSIILYYIVLYYIILCFIILCYIMLYYIILCFIILCYIILCYIILFNVLLYYVILYYVVFYI